MLLSAADHHSMRSLYQDSAPISAVGRNRLHWLIKERQKAFALVEPPRIIILCIDKDGKGCNLAADRSEERVGKQAATVTFLRSHACTLPPLSRSSAMCSKRVGQFSSRMPRMSGPRRSATTAILDSLPPPQEGLNAFAETVEVVSLQADCRSGRDMRFEMNRGNTKKKKKKPVN